MSLVFLGEEAHSHVMDNDNIDLEPYTLAKGTITTEYGHFHVHVTDDPDGDVTVSISNAVDTRAIAFSGGVWTEDGYTLLGNLVPYPKRVRDAMVAICATQAAAYKALRQAGVL